MVTYFIGYSIGSVLAGFIAGAMGLALGKLLRLENPWAPAVAVMALLLLLGTMSLAGLLQNPKSEDLVFTISFAPALFWSVGGWFRCRRRRREPEVRTEF